MKAEIPLPENATVDAPNQGSSDFVVKPGLLEEDVSMETADTGTSQTVYAKNLNFATSEDQLGHPTTCSQDP